MQTTAVVDFEYIRSLIMRNVRILIFLKIFIGNECIDHTVPLHLNFTHINVFRKQLRITLIVMLVNSLFVFFQCMHYKCLQTTYL